MNKTNAMSYINVWIVNVSGNDKYFTFYFISLILFLTYKLNDIYFNSIIHSTRSYHLYPQSRTIQLINLVHLQLKYLQHLLSFPTRLLKISFHLEEHLHHLGHYKLSFGFDSMRQ